MKKTKISILSPNVSNNSLGRVYLLATILSRQFDVEVLGPAFPDGVWEPLRGSLKCRTVSLKHFPFFFPEVHRLLHSINGDIIYAHKPLFTSYTLGLVKKLSSNRPVILDIDDIEAPLISRFRGKRNIFFPNSYASTLINERLIPFADEKTVAGRSLQRRYGGHLIWHARDTDKLSPERWNADSIREKYHIEPEQRVIGFFGTPRPYKGLDDLIEAIALLKDPRILFMVVGLAGCPYSNYIRQMARKNLDENHFIDAGTCPINELPYYLAAADVIVIPQKRTVETEVQVPAKVFDAMAMAKPVVATNVSDLPEILDGCGYLAQPGDPPGLADAIDSVLANPESAEKIGQRARQKCIREYSYDAMRYRLSSVFHECEK